MPAPPPSAIVAARKIEEAGIAKLAAEAIAEAILDTHDDFATKSDIDAAVGTLRTEFADRETRINDKINDFRTDLDGKINELSGQVAKLAGEISRLDGRIDGIDGRIDGIDGRIDGIDSKLDGINAKLEGIDGRINGAVVKAMGAGFGIALVLFGAILGLAAADVI